MPDAVADAAPASMVSPGAVAFRFAVLHGGRERAAWQSTTLDRLAQANAHCVLEVPVQDSGRASLADELQSYRLDFILSFVDSAPPAALLTVPRHGVWRCQLGDWVNYRGGPGGYWEVYEGCAASAAMLVRLTPDPDEVAVLRQCFLRTQQRSPRKNREALLSRMTEWPAAVCRELARGVHGARRAGREVGAAGERGAGGAEPRLRAIRAARAVPSSGQRAVLALRIAARIAAAGYRSLFRHDQWNIGIVERPIQDLLSTPVPTDVAWFPPTPRAELRADPIGVVHAGVETILCEYFSYHDQVGFIVAMDPQGGGVSGRVRIGPEPAVHLSYPFVLEAEGVLHCMPECSAAGEVVLYAAERFPEEWRRSETLIADRALADATLFPYGNRWWLAASEVADKGANCELHLWYAAAVMGPWTAHPGNPVKVDVRSARPAGAPFWADGALYRPAQDCSSTYGARVVLNRIVRLTPDEFEEEAAAAVNPDPTGPYPDGLHTLSSLGGRTLIDGKRSVFVPVECWRNLKHLLS